MVNFSCNVFGLHVLFGTLFSRRRSRALQPTERRLGAGGAFYHFPFHLHFSPPLAQNRQLYAVIFDGRNSRVCASRVNYMEWNCINL